VQHHTDSTPCSCFSLIFLFLLYFFWGGGQVGLATVPLNHFAGMRTLPAAPQKGPSPGHADVPYGMITLRPRHILAGTCELLVNADTTAPAAAVGFGRIAVSKAEAPNRSVDLVERG
jgi:hypothetical protein